MKLNNITTKRSDKSSTSLLTKNTRNKAERSRAKSEGHQSLNVANPILKQEEFWAIIFGCKPNLIAQILKENSDLCPADGDEIFSLLCKKYEEKKYRKMGYPTWSKLMKRMRWCKEDYRRKWLTRYEFTDPVEMELIVKKAGDMYVGAAQSRSVLECLLEGLRDSLGERHLVILKTAIENPDGGFNRTALYEAFSDEERELFLPKCHVRVVADQRELIKKAIASRTREVRDIARRYFEDNPGLI